ncbi:dynein heavy chain and region D6 of dynein motor-domain-containing protein [Chytridium lagenaria]|nr:dynein heavy chain and region D6 of dynein motor-domain-containing protein [Chytridium lagenaria]
MSSEEPENARLDGDSLSGGDPSALKIHLERLLPVVMDADPSDVRNSLFVMPEAVERKTDAKITKEDDDIRSFLYSVALELSYTDKHVSALVLIKRTSIIESTRPLQTQLQLIILPGPSDGGNAFETLHSYIHNAVSPFFDAYLSAKTIVPGTMTNRDDKDSKTGIPMAKKKIAELELSLLQLQQNVEIPEISLTIHPVVQRTADVNGWIKEIQRVTKFQRDPTTELRVRNQLLVEYGTSRFHATVSFLADTGLKESTEKVQKYNQLMRDFPLNELLSATDKLKLSPYPIKRALPLVGAISKDLNEQLLKVLGSRRVMWLGYEEFEKATSGCEEVFRTWDEQAKEFTNVAMMKPEKMGEKMVNLSDVNALDDVNWQGTEIWVSAENTYNERVARVENQIIARLRDRLGTAKNANEMFRVFSKFNALFVRPKIRGAIQEYQTQLIENVKEDIKKLHDKFKMQYRNSEAYHMSQVRDLPPISGAIIWARQIERVELYAEGQKLQSESGSFRKKLETKPICDQWLAEITKRDLNVSGRIFEITRNRGIGTLALGINFDSQIITLFKEVRNLVWFGYQIPHTVANVAKDAKRVYPFAVSLSETVRTYSQTVGKVAKNGVVVDLVAAYRKDVQTHISKGIQLRWDYFVNTYDSRPFSSQTNLSESYRENRHVVFVREFASIVSVFQDKVNSAISIYDEIKLSIEELKICVFSREKFQDTLDKIQRSIDRLNLESYSNLDSWTADLDLQIEDVLAPGSKQLSNLGKNRARRGTVVSSHGDEFKNEKERPLIKAIVHEIRLKNQSMYLDPPLEFGRQNFYGQLHEWLSVVCDLRRIQSSRYDITIEKNFEAPKSLNYTNLLIKLQDNTVTMAYGAIENMLSRVSSYVTVWLQYQSLWDLENEYVYSKLGEDLGKREILNRFGTKLGVNMKDFFSLVSKARTELEMQSVEGNSTAEAVSFITFVQDLKKKLPQWTNDVEIFRQSAKGVGETEIFVFRPDWLFLDNVEGEWSAFNEILTRKNNVIQEQIGGLQMKIIAEEKIVKQKIEDILGEWNKDKPVRGDIKPADATNFLSTFEAREALDLDLITDNRLEPLIEELRDLKGVWNSLSQVWGSLYEIKDTLWTSVMPRKTKQQLDVLLSSTKDMPTRCSEALRDRHWKQIFKVLKFEGTLSFTEITLGHLWDGDLKRHETVLKEVVVTAQGEMALEEFIRMVRETWTSFSLELVNYQNKCRLIRGWDDLFSKCSEHLNSLTAMKHSPYYKVFEEEASSWEDKLNRIHLLFDVWIDVQRQWVYLEGIFTGNTDIKQLLPIESQRFQNINLEFMNAMKKVYKSPLVLDVLNVPGIQKSLERLADLLAKIQKALGEYLERERSSFPRFYFVGDEDLLDIIGNSKDVLRIQKHFKKMFAGISRIMLSEDNGQILGLVSKEGEEVPLKTPIVIKDHSRINDWLLAIEKEMKSFYFAETVSESALLDWIEKFPAQLINLSAQIAWTHAVEKSFAEKNLDGTLQTVLRSLTLLADIVLRDLPPIRRRKCEHLITELVHQRDVVRSLIKIGATHAKDFSWLYQMRFYWNEKAEDPLQRLSIRMANATFFYGFEYLGVADRLVQTPLTDRCYLTMTQALDGRLGGSPFGPAGTGKTESVKALGCQLGRFVLVFCCDENFDFQAMGRIFIGLCQVGAWGCFDEFNRLEERILSAVSQQIQTIQLGLKDGNEIELVNKPLKVNSDTGIFITMNPGYAGRSNLPDNLKKLFRSIAMTHPDRELIAQVMLYSQGFRTAELLASKVVPLFNLCSEQLSTQSHYDFGLRSLKSVLVSAGNLKRDRPVGEQEIVIQSVRETLVPKLVAEDIPLLQSLLQDVFPGVNYVPVDLEKLKDCINSVCKRRNLTGGEFWIEKSSAWRVLLEALELADGTEGSSMDNTTREWTDGLFTHILRKIIDNVRGESLRRHWIVFDGDVDPEWVENLNSVLDDNKLLTLPNGERLSLPPNVRIMFEVETLRYATLATVSRCGMNLKTISLDEGEEDTLARRAGDGSGREESLSLLTQKRIADILSPFFRSQGLVSRCLGFVLSLAHIMDFTRVRVLGPSFRSEQGCSQRPGLQLESPRLPLTSEHLEKYISKKLESVWGVLRSLTSVDMPLDSSSVLDFDVDLTSGEWLPWHSRVPTIEIETHNVSAADVVIPTVDTLRHEEVLYSWLSEHKPLLLCGPPGSGKLPDMEVVGLNFSSGLLRSLSLRRLSSTVNTVRQPTGVVLSPQLIGKWLVLFCDEINLPASDKYGTQRVISFIRQLVEHGGFWRASDKTWVKLERIQFSPFPQACPLLFVDYPQEVSLYQIYSTFLEAMLKVAPNLRAYSDPLTYAMIEFFLKSQQRFTPDIQSHYIYSPRELTRWIRGIFEVMKTSELPTVQDLVRLWVHEGLRLFQDRLVSEDERKWTDDTIDEIALKHFPNLDPESLLEVSRNDLRDFVKARLKVFYDEELDVPIVLFNDVLDHVLRIDRVFRQMQGHLLLIGVSGSGKTTLSRFVAWMNGLSVFQIKVHNKYSAADFDEDLRIILRRAGCKGEKICFIMDESNVLDAGFLERMNTLLANAEIPGLFEGDEYASLMTQCKEGAQREGLMLDSSEELYKWFTQQVMRNLHIVFTMNPPEGGLASRAATSPALFNRCVLDWFGDWSDQAFYQVGKEFTESLDLDVSSYIPPLHFPIAYRDLSLPPNYRAAVINAFVFVHQSLYEINNRLSRRQGRSYHVTPRHYLDFINQFVKLYIEKREDLEEQQRHLNVGLDKLRDTVVKVEELRRSLAIKKAELELKNDQANEKLKTMVADQQEAEQQKVSSLRIQGELSKQNVLIEERKRIVMSDLADAEPAVVEAQKSVSSIKKQHLTEVRAMGNPPEAVKIAMESVCILLGHKIDAWKSVQAIIRKDDFITSIVNYDTDKMTQRIRDEISRNYLTNPVFNFESVNRASKACGPLVQWVIAQVRFAEILERVGPLRQEVLELENSADATRQKATNIENMIANLESSIAHYKDEYAVLISETQALKSEMETVKSRVDRSLALLGNLSSENERWGQASQSFESQMGTIIGDVLLSSAYLAYGGFFDQQYREALLVRWVSHLESANIKFKSDLSIPEYLSTADERLLWQENQLPADDLCTENAIMLKRFNRYPLIIDPSGQASSFLLNMYRNKKIMVTSFLDDSFLKVLESALRFGNPLLVQDVENLDPILNAVLNKEIRRTGGRVLIRLGGQDIDFSPSFTLFLSTRDPSVNFPPDICSRVTFVNFTVTRSSLQSQCLHQVLKAERPDTDRKRTDLIKLRGEFQLRLRHLEKSLLQALNDSKGNILEDDNIIATLEKLKQEAAEVTKKVEDTDIVMQEVESVTATYTPLAQACSSIFFCLEQLSLLHHFYQFSLDFFLDIFQYLLHDNPNLVGVTDYTERLKRIFEHLFRLTYSRAARSLLHEDQLVFALQMAQIKSRVSSTGLNDEEFDLLISAEDLRDRGMDAELVSIFGEEVCKRVQYLAAQSNFSTLISKIKENVEVWRLFWNDETPELNVPKFWEDDLSNLNVALRKIVLIKAFRPDRLLPSTVLLAETALQTPTSAELDLKALVLTEIKSSTPLAFCSVPGYDASKMVEDFASNSSQKIVGVAMGSAEGFTLAETAISTGVKTGTWVLLKNVHLSPQWLSQLEKRLHSMKAHENFRLFLTMETNPKVPVNLLRLSRVLMFEPPPGIKANLNVTIARISPSRLSRGPVERNRLYFLLAWLHAIIQERLRYVPIGWTKSYEFNESDYDMALTVIDSWLEDAAGGRSNVSPEKIPFDAIKSLLTETVYGGKIDNSFDQVLLDEGSNKLVIPEGTRMEQIMQWVGRLPDQQPPSWLGLPSNAERVLMASKGFETLSKVRQIKQALDDFESVAEKSESGNKNSSIQPTWMKTVLTSVLDWLNFLPESLAGIPRAKDAIMDPLQRYFDREHKIGASLLKTVRNDLLELKYVCEGKVKQTNNTRHLVDCVTKGIIPTSWNRYKVARTASLPFWIGDFKQRLDQVAGISKSEDVRRSIVWMGGLFLPEAYTTATRQDVSQRNGWSLEELSLKVHVGTSDSKNAFQISDLRLYGGEWKNKAVQLSSDVFTKLQDVDLLFVAHLDTNEGARSTIAQHAVAILTA